jgi:hypothetical protein
MRNRIGAKVAGRSLWAACRRARASGHAWVIPHTPRVHLCSASVPSSPWEPPLTQACEHGARWERHA